ncbi:MAG: UDP-glucose 4-epimerase GalE [Bacteroidota bacterium]
MGGKILVTGGAGYIGAHTAYALFQAGYTPVILDNFSRSDDTLIQGLGKLMGQAPMVFKGSCTDAPFLEAIFSQHQIDGVMHFAAFKAVGESVEKPLLYYRNNLESLTTLLQVMGTHQVKDFIFSSSCTVYGQPERVPVTEDAPFKRAESPYGATKQMCERILEDVYPLGFRVISLRYFNPIGAHPSAWLGEIPIGAPNNLVPYITQTAIGKRQKLVVFGNDYNTPDGSNVRDFIHVVDLANAHVKALALLKKQTGSSYYDVFNLGTGVGVSVLELVNKFQEVTGVRLNWEMGPRRPGDVEITYADPAKANNVMGWRTEHSIEDALRDAWRWEQKLAGLPFS